MKKIRIKNKDFCHCHCHTEYSTFDGVNKISSFPMKAREMGFRSLAITDHGNMGGAIKFINECTRKVDKNGKEIEFAPIKPLVGIEFYLAKNRFANTVDEQPDKRKGNRHLCLIAKNAQGYRNICKLTQSSWVDGFYMDPRIDIELLSEHKEGLICSSACLSSVVNSNLLHGRYDKARKAASMLKDIFKEDFFLEVMYHGIDAEGIIIPDIIKLGKELGIPVIATNDVHYCTQDQGKSQEVLLAMSTSKCLNDKNRLHFPYNEFYLKSAEEMLKMFGNDPRLLLNTNILVDRVDEDDIKNYLFQGGTRLPDFNIPDNFKSSYDYLKYISYEGMKKIGWDKSKEHMDRLNQELEDVKIALVNNNYDFATYFLIVQDYINYARKNNILTGCGRGSGYGSVLLRALGISYGPDPLKYDLLWERFLGFDNKKFITNNDFGL